jgi:hypothetical protein
MNEFKAGDEIVRVRVGTSWAHIGYKATVLENYEYLCKDGEYTPIRDNQWELVKLKWTIYNNEKAWQDLSDKQKGKIMVAENDGHEIKGLNCTALNKPVRFDCHHITYFAVEPEPVKPEPTMAEVLTKDVLGCSGFLRPHDVDELIAKGWTKPCK